MAEQTIPQLTRWELGALRIAARQNHRTPPNERVENHRLGHQYVQQLTEMGLLGETITRLGRTLEITQFGAETIRAYTWGNRRPQPKARTT